MNKYYPFVLEPLPYDYDALEPYIDAETVKIHHNNHMGTYVNNLNKALADYPNYHNWSLEKLITQNYLLPSKIKTAVLNNAGGVYNHSFYFKMLTDSRSKTSPGELLLEAINQSFGSFEQFKNEFTQAALSVFGSGYAWLMAKPDGSLYIATTKNQDTNLNLYGCKILVIDVWEHAYYLAYQYKRVEYINNIFNLFNWQRADELYSECLNG